jgi:hypothetical protein
VGREGKCEVVRVGECECHTPKRDVEYKGGTHVLN